MLIRATLRKYPVVKVSHSWPSLVLSGETENAEENWTVLNVSRHCRNQ